MRRVNYLIPFVLLVFGLAVTANGQKETYTGTVLSYGTGLNTRTNTAPFTLIINRQTSDQRAQSLLGLLQEGDQETLLNAVRQEDVGSFSINGRIGPRVNVVREQMIGGRMRIFAAFERWKNVGELRGGYRSLDYPFGVIELYIDPQTGKGEGTYVAAAQVRWKRDKKTGQNQIEIENFATFPAKLMGVSKRGR
jgi:hypothetical protein